MRTHFRSLGDGRRRVPAWGQVRLCRRLVAGFGVYTEVDGFDASS